MSRFAGVWRCNHHENMDKLFLQIGAPPEIAKKAAQGETTITIKLSDNQTVHFKIESGYGTEEVTAKIGEPFEHKRPNGKKTVIVKESDSRMRVNLMDTEKPGHTTCEICGNELHITSTVGCVTAKSRYTKL
ncbi:unnamed protein product [Calicophoron daubneyi]|uniref:Uncharacterized protein n=1 Tax=Calicophoron daubneyi TaxID=300641 RepID=A0AAV2TR28_CALDB